MKRNLRRVGIIISCLLGLELEAALYYVFGINPSYVPLIAVVGLWLAITVMVGCVVDEVLKRKFGIRLIRV
ncbi:MAG: hypothetical protein IJB96_09500 [Lachnospira sp.]|nr:hypothetical protein [Lachnospira sp.]